MPLATIDTVLFDADGVIQRPTVDWRAALSTYVPAESADEFVLDLMVSERPSIAGKGDFREAVAEVLARWSSTASPEDILHLWSAFEADPVVVGWIQELRAAGIGCHLATNQHTYRRAIMNDERHYGDLFDQSFYSCDLGLAKPDPAYFKAILAAVDRPAASTLFIDDNEPNIEGARSAGLHAELYDLSQGHEVLRELLVLYGLTVSS
ncbi:HAD-IA family hydrolase [Streptomyces sp. SID13031]|uniref:HAD family hydrolase n=1 Tax=Streptomyces sp. SID13031 TaxID=2706046 RepID=UPI0013C6173A|nr:HAD-IA family hydrolase [Streptomyces sp. SID13031]NEA35252.1 HAD-IA family hydrolase [Streptomyces sp. SID13031]